jgi:hypothetical protein
VIARDRVIKRYSHIGTRISAEFLFIDGVCGSLVSDHPINGSTNHPILISVISVNQR